MKVATEITLSKDGEGEVKFTMPASQEWSDAQLECMKVLGEAGFTGEVDTEVEA